MKQKDAGLRKKGTPLLSDMAIQMEPITIMVRLKRAKIAAARFKSVSRRRQTILDADCKGSATKLASRLFFVEEFK